MFEQRFAQRAIRGTGHVFGIVVDCDSRRLQTLAAALPAGRSQVAEYRFVFEAHTRNRALARIIGGDLDPAVTACIVDRYY